MEWIVVIDKSEKIKRFVRLNSTRIHWYKNMYKANVTRVTNLFLLDKDQNANREKKEREREGRMNVFYTNCNERIHGDRITKDPFDV